jgi:hypothetical protein
MSTKDVLGHNLKKGDLVLIIGNFFHNKIAAGRSKLIPNKEFNKQMPDIEREYWQQLEDKLVEQRDEEMKKDTSSKEFEEGGEKKYVEPITPGEIAESESEYKDLLLKEWEEGRKMDPELVKDTLKSKGRDVVPDLKKEPLKEGDKVRIPPSHFDPYNPAVSKGSMGRVISVEEDVRSDINVGKVDSLIKEVQPVEDAMENLLYAYNNFITYKAFEEDTKEIDQKIIKLRETINTLAEDDLQYKENIKVLTYLEEELVAVTANAKSAYDASRTADSIDVKSGGTKTITNNDEMGPDNSFMYEKRRLEEFAKPIHDELSGYEEGYSKVKVQEKDINNENSELKRSLISYVEYLGDTVLLNKFDKLKKIENLEGLSENDKMEKLKEKEKQISIAPIKVYDLKSMVAKAIKSFKPEDAKSYMPEDDTGKLNLYPAQILSGVIDNINIQTLNEINKNSKYKLYDLIAKSYGSLRSNPKYEKESGIELIRRISNAALKKYEKSSNKEYISYLNSIAKNADVAENIINYINSIEDKESSKGDMIEVSDKEIDNYMDYVLDLIEQLNYMDGAEELLSYEVFKMSKVVNRNDLINKIACSIELWFLKKEEALLNSMLF